MFDPYFQPWTGGGQHYAFFNQPVAAGHNFGSFCTALKPLLASSPVAWQQLEEIENGFASEMQTQMDQMWAAKLGLSTFNKEIFNELIALMIETSVDYTIFFRELSAIPDDIKPLKKSFYPNAKQIDDRWSAWLEKWKALINITEPARSHEEISKHMKRVNPKYLLREWLVVPAYKSAAAGSYALTREVQDVMTQPYAEQSEEVEGEYARLKPSRVL